MHRGLTLVDALIYNGRIMKNGMLNTNLRRRRRSDGSYRVGEYVIKQTGNREWTTWSFEKGYAEVKATYRTLREATTWTILRQTTS